MVLQDQRPAFSSRLYSFLNWKIVDFGFLDLLLQLVVEMVHLGVEFNLGVLIVGITLEIPIQFSLNLLQFVLSPSLIGYLLSDVPPYSLQLGLLFGLFLLFVRASPLVVFGQVDFRLFRVHCKHSRLDFCYVFVPFLMVREPISGFLVQPVAAAPLNMDQ